MVITVNVSALTSKICSFSVLYLNQQKKVLFFLQHIKQRDGTCVINCESGKSLEYQQKSC